MNRRHLRTVAVLDPQTLGQRIRFARTENNLTQEDLAAGIGKLTRSSKINKSLISIWEKGGVSSPTHANLMAVQSITGFSAKWLATGVGERKMRLTSTDLNVERLTQVLKALNPEAPNPRGEALAISVLYKILTDNPDTPAATLDQVAGALPRDLN
ncbi:helix-turn-helix domain-containing protein [Lysobacter sp. CA196]|uniref:helix-turn-helix domain-containing protein n=1 Tax=Lysobacter sp. CA196 TaxID=3455606 RepID=UPI003F8D1285